MRRNLQVFRNTFRKLGVQLPYLWRAVGLMWQAAHGWTLAWSFLLVVQGALPVAVVYLSRLVVDSLVAVMGAGADWALVEPVAIQVGLLAIVLLLQGSLRSVASFIRTVQSELARDYMSGLVHQKSMEVDLAFYDSPEYYDQLHRARGGASYRAMSLLESMGVLLQNSITLVSMLIVLLPYGAWLPLTLLVSTLPALYVVMHHRLQLHHWTMKTTESERRSWYYDNLLTSRESAAELRLFQLSEYFRSVYQSLRRMLRDERIQLARSHGSAEVLASGSALLVTGAAMFWMVWRVVEGQASLGDLVLFYSAFNQGQSLMRAFLENVGEIYTSSFFLGDLFDFLSLKPRVLEPEHPLPMPAAVRQHIRLQGIHFAYPGSSRITLQDFNLEIEAGQVIAIVGPNGAGKSTLIKLLCRFYDPQEGVISIDGEDIRNFAVDDLRAHITALFQEPLHFNATVRQNIALGDAPEESKRYSVDGNQEKDHARGENEALFRRIVEAAEAAGADQPVSRLPQGYDSVLGKWFQGGADLSVGEWQRIALARAFLRKAPIIILDEPTSAMDPWAETDWLARFRKLAAGRTAILITHRFTTAAFADKIYVMDEGKIVESGNHQELLNSNGRYAASWKEQMRRWLDASQASPGGELSA